MKEHFSLFDRKEIEFNDGKRFNDFLKREMISSLAFENDKNPWRIRGINPRMIPGYSKFSIRLASNKFQGERERWSTGTGGIPSAYRGEEARPLWGGKNSLRYSRCDKVKKGFPAFTVETARLAIVPPQMANTRKRFQLSSARTEPWPSLLLSLVSSCHHHPECFPPRPEQLPPFRYSSAVALTLFNFDRAPLHCA